MIDTGEARSAHGGCPRSRRFGWAGWRRPQVAAGKTGRALVLGHAQLTGAASRVAAARTAAGRIDPAAARAAGAPRSPMRLPPCRPRRRFPPCRRCPLRRSLRRRPMPPLPPASAGASTRTRAPSGASSPTSRPLLPPPPPVPPPPRAPPPSMPPGESSSEQPEPHACMNTRAIAANSRRVTSVFNGPSSGPLSGGRPRTPDKRHPARASARVKEKSNSAADSLGTVWITRTDTTTPG